MVIYYYFELVFIYVYIVQVVGLEDMGGCFVFVVLGMYYQYLFLEFVGKFGEQFVCFGKVIVLSVEEGMFGWWIEGIVIIEEDDGCVFF